MRLAFLGALAAALQLGAGCGRAWPTVIPVADPGFLHSGGVRTVALLPVDVTVAAAPETVETPDVIYQRFAGSAAYDVAGLLGARGYVVVQAPLAGDRLAATLDAFARYGMGPPGLRGPDLPGPVGDADATLYVGGFAYAGVDDDGMSAGEVVGIVVLAVFVVVVLVAIAAAGGKGGHGGGGHGGGGHGGGGHVGAVHVGHVGRSVGGLYPRGTTINIGLPSGPPVPDEGPSHMLLDLMLVDNRTGQLLWRARETLPASPARDDDVMEAMGRMLERLPRAR